MPVATSIILRGVLAGGSEAISHLAFTNPPLAHGPSRQQSPG